MQEPKPPFVFLSYDTDDRDVAIQVKNGLEAALKLDVWWDRDIPTGGKWRSELESAIRRASCVVVLWSDKSCKSDWVKQEAAIASVLGKLAPAMVDDCKLPAPYDGDQAARLKEWDNDTEHPQFRRLADRVRGCLEESAMARAKPKLSFATIVISLLAAVLAAYLVSHATSSAVSEAYRSSEAFTAFSHKHIGTREVPGRLEYPVTKFVSGRGWDGIAFTAPRPGIYVFSVSFVRDSFLDMDPSLDKPKSKEGKEFGIRDDVHVHIQVDGGTVATGRAPQNETPCWEKEEDENRWMRPCRDYEFDHYGTRESGSATVVVALSKGQKVTTLAGVDYPGETPEEKEEKLYLEAILFSGFYLGARAPDSGPE